MLLPLSSAEVAGGGSRKRSRPVRPRIALALGSGGLKGMAHIGVQTSVETDASERPRREPGAFVF
jgi:hypothetical protein